MLCWIHKSVTQCASVRSSSCYDRLQSFDASCTRTRSYRCTYALREDERTIIPRSGFSDGSAWSMESESGTARVTRYPSIRALVTPPIPLQFHAHDALAASTQHRCSRSSFSIIPNRSRARRAVRTVVSPT